MNWVYWRPQNVVPFFEIKLPRLLGLIAIFVVIHIEKSHIFTHYFGVAIYIFRLFYFGTKRPRVYWMFEDA